MKRKAERAMEEKEYAAEDDVWTQRDVLRLQKAQLALELHKQTAGQGGGKDPTMSPQASTPVETTEPKPGKTAADIQTVGQVNNGDPNNPDWPASTMGTEAAKRRATPEEEAAHQQTGLAANPADADANFHHPEHGTKSAGALLAAVKTAADLTQGQRDKLPKKDFALPGGKYPIEDERHARNALARAAQFASPSEQATIRAKVHKKFPGIQETKASEPAKPTVGLHHVPGHEKKSALPLGSTASGIHALEQGIAARGSQIRAAVGAAPIVRKTPSPLTVQGLAAKHRGEGQLRALEAHLGAKTSGLRAAVGAALGHPF